MNEVKGEWVNTVLRAVVLASDNGEVQLTILTRALAIAAKTCGVGLQPLLENLEHAYASEQAMTKKMDA